MADWSPLAYFRELHLLLRVIFTIGGVLFLSSPFLRDLALCLFSVGIVFAAVALNFLINLTWMEPGPPYRTHISWESLWQALLSLAIAGACLGLAAYRYHFGVLPALLQPK